MSYFEWERLFLEDPETVPLPEDEIDLRHFISLLVNNDKCSFPLIEKFAQRWPFPTNAIIVQTALRSHFDLALQSSSVVFDILAPLTEVRHEFDKVKKGHAADYEKAVAVFDVGSIEIEIYHAKKLAKIISEFPPKYHSRIHERVDFLQTLQKRTHEKYMLRGKESTATYLLETYLYQSFLVEEVIKAIREHNVLSAEELETIAATIQLL